MLMWEIHILGRRNLMDAWESDCGGDRDDPAVQGACPASDRPFGKATRDLVSDIDGMGAAAAAEVLYTKDGKVNVEWQRLDNNLPSIDRIISAFYDNKGKKPADWYGCFNVQLVHWQVRSRGAAHAARGALTAADLQVNRIKWQFDLLSATGIVFFQRLLKDVVATVGKTTTSAQ